MGKILLLWFVSCEVKISILVRYKAGGLAPLMLWFFILFQGQKDSLLAGRAAGKTAVPGRRRGKLQLLSAGRAFNDLLITHIYSLYLLIK
jgi:hypothetical protein